MATSPYQGYVTQSNEAQVAAQDAGISGRSYPVVDPAELDAMARDTATELARLREEHKRLTAANGSADALALLAESIADAQAKLDYIDAALEELKAEASAESPATPAEAKQERTEHCEHEHEARLVRKQYGGGQAHDHS